MPLLGDTSSPIMGISVSILPIPIHVQDMRWSGRPMASALLRGAEQESYEYGMPLILDERRGDTPDFVFCDKNVHIG
jgi:hypothetical protein